MVQRNDILDKAHDSAYGKLSNILNQTIDRLVVYRTHLDGNCAQYPIGSSLIIFEKDEAILTSETAATSLNYVIFCQGRISISPYDREKKLGEFFEDVIIHEYLHSIFVRRYLKQLGHHLLQRTSSDEDIPSKLPGHFEEQGYTRTVAGIISKSIIKNCKRGKIPLAYILQDPFLFGINEAFAYSVTESITEVKSLYDSVANSYDSYCPNVSKPLKNFYRIFNRVIAEKGLEYLLQNLPDIVLSNRDKMTDDPLEQLPDEMLRYLDFQSGHEDESPKPANPDKPSVARQRAARAKFLIRQKLSRN